MFYLILPVHLTCSLLYLFVILYLSVSSYLSPIHLFLDLSIFYLSTFYLSAVFLYFLSFHLSIFYPSTLYHSTFYLSTLYLSIFLPYCFLSLYCHFFFFISFLLCFSHSILLSDAFSYSYQTCTSLSRCCFLFLVDEGRIRKKRS